MAPKVKKTKRNNNVSSNETKPKQVLVETSSKPSFIAEIMSESVAGFTDSMFTQFCLSICWFLFTKNDWMQNYFESPIHMYWICYFIHVNIIDSYIWGSAYRNSVNYIYDKFYIQTIFRTLIIIFCQYLSVFIGVWSFIQLVKLYFINDDSSIALELQYTFVGRYESPLNLSRDELLTFIWQSALFQIIDRIVNGLLVTFRPILKQKTLIFDGSWMQITFRCIIMHLLIVNNRMGVINNPNYSFYACLFYWRWSIYDLIILTLPYFCIIVFNVLFSNLPILHNPTYFIASSKKKIN